MGSYWHPFADMAAVAASGPLVIASGDGAYVTDEAGRRYLDATAALWYCNVGHGRAALGAAAAAQMSSLAAYTTFGDYATRPTLELAERVAAIAPVPGSKVFLTSGGSDSVDTAVKLARRYWQVVGRPEKTVVVSRRHGYHGMHAGGTSLSGIPANRLGYGPLLADTAQVPWDSAEALAAVLDATGPDRVAAFFVEPVVGAGGVFPPPAGYLESVEKICRDRDVLLVCDEVITGYGRIGGFWFGVTRFGLQPDIVTGAKGVTSGYAPLGTVLVAPRVAEPFWRAGTGMWRHGYTYSGHATACAVALANLDVIEEENLLAEAARLEGTLHTLLAPLADHDLVSEVRSGTGAMAAVQVDPAALAVDAALPARVAAALRGHGVLTRVLATGGLQVSPSFVTTDDDVKLLAEAFGAALDDVARA
ncbi:aspartate aminotransferase family protein [Kineosporia sp. R_H_3]|uniref:aminotransferase family protein n=1 Tax=Kineosporia sp. R_H_3 TaxID=1961848 RepID=UPI0018EA18E1|nr:aminotransferase class III-fold pyridoxal phosphate-dependent enzyme [Kineosporia sp. R_H_3]